MHSIPESRMENGPSAVSINTDSKDLSLSTSAENLTQILREIQKKCHLASSSVNEIGFIDEKEYKNSEHINR